MTELDKLRKKIGSEIKQEDRETRGEHKNGKRVERAAELLQNISFSLPVAQKSHKTTDIRITLPVLPG